MRSVQNSTPACSESSSDTWTSEAMAEFSGDSQNRFEAGDGEAEDKGLALKPHAQAHLLSATEYCKVKLKKRIGILCVRCVISFDSTNVDHKSDLLLKFKHKHVLLCGS